MAILGWITKYSAIMGDGTSKAHQAYHQSVQNALKKRTPQKIHAIYEEWGKSLKI